MSFSLEVDENGRRRVVGIAGSECIIGRGHDVDVPIADPRSSRKHCRVRRTPQGFLLEDLQSRNGTLLNGYTVQKSFLKPGEEFRVGNTRFRLREEPAESGPHLSDDTPRDPGASEAATIAPTHASVSRDATPHRQEQGLSPLSSDEDEELLLEEPSPAGTSPPGRTSPSSRTAAEEAVRVEESAPQAAPPAADRTPAHSRSSEAYLEGLEGSHAGERVEIDRSPFIIGRAKECHFRLKDTRASGQHARIVREGAGWVLEDLGSTNGTSLNRKPVRRAYLAPLSTIQVGNSAFRVHLPPEAAAAVPSSVDSDASEEFVRFDIDKFLARDRSQRPLAVAAVVIVWVIIGYFTVDITRRVVTRVDPDPSVPANLVLANWSFEEPPPKGAPAGTIPGWTLSAEAIGGGVVERGDAQAIVVGDAAQPPGSRAVRLRGGPDLTMLCQEVKLEAGAFPSLRLEGHVLNEDAFASGFFVEWFRDARDRSISLGRSFGEAARRAGEALDLDQVLRPPPGTSWARVCLCVVSPGSAIFDRVSLTPVAETEAAAESPPEEAKLAGGVETRSFPLRGRKGPATQLRLLPEGTFAVERPGRPPVLPALWAALSSDRDPGALGPRLSAPRAVADDANNVVFLCDVPDWKERRWTSVEATTTLGRDALSLRWRTSVGNAGKDKEVSGLWLYLEVPDGLRFEVYPPGVEASRDPTGNLAVQECVLGERDEKVSLSFSPPVRLTARRPAVGPPATLWTAESSESELTLVLCLGSKHESTAAMAALEAAEASFRSGRAGAAMQALARFGESFPPEGEEAARARERLAEWEKEADGVLAGLRAECQELGDTPSTILRGILERRLSAFAESYRGADAGRAAEALVQELGRQTAEAESRRAALGLRALHEAGRKFFAEDRLSLATLFLNWVSEADPGGEVGQDARNTLRMIESRRERIRKTILQ